MKDFDGMNEERFVNKESFVDRDSGVIFEKI